MKKYAIIVAGGSGKRMGGDLPKQFLLLHGKPVLYYTIKVFLDSDPTMQLIIVLPDEHLGAGQEIIDGYFSYDRITLCAGGRTRFHSVQNGLKLVEEESIILVHDAVRCTLTTALIQSVCKAAEQDGTAVPVINCTDSIRIIGEQGSEAFDREKIKLVQTPQGFHSKILIPAYAIDYKPYFTDEASVVEAYGLKIKLVEGETNNIKVTLPVDLEIAANLLLPKN